MADNSTQTSNNKDTGEDLSDVKLLAAIGYLGILFLVPMLARPKSEFAMFHANQGLILLIAGVAVSVVGGMIPILGWLIILPLGSLFVFVLFIMGVVNAMGGKMKELPLIGKWEILKVQS